MAEGPTPRALFIGRWSPFHLGHDAIIREALNAGKRVAIAVRDTPLSDSDPYTVNERLDMIREHFEDDDVEVFWIPDIESVNIGRGVGYEVKEYETPQEVSSISATEIRRKLREGDSSWERDVPADVAGYLHQLHFHKRLQEGCVIWLTGLPCSGKTTLAGALRGALVDIPGVRRRGVKMLDGDDLRKGLCSDLGFSAEDRDENVRRVAHLAAMLANGKAIVIVALVSPRREARERAREIIGPTRFFEVHINCPVEVCQMRDVKGMYARVASGEITGFTGVDAPYEEPVNPVCVVDTSVTMVGQSLTNLMMGLRVAMMGACHESRCDQP